ncbi:hypothetical protein M0804_008809 [Polistes exclamans]|nr:hypothetical protein M0804_008809 [Polistes exclamans]
MVEEDRIKKKKNFDTYHTCSLELSRKRKKMFTISLSHISANGINCRDSISLANTKISLYLSRMHTGNHLCNYGHSIWFTVEEKNCENKNRTSKISLYFCNRCKIFKRILAIPSRRKGKCSCKSYKVPTIDFTRPSWKVLKGKLTLSPTTVATLTLLWYTCVTG